MAVILEDPPLYLGKLNESDPDITYPAYADRFMLNAVFQQEGVVETSGFRVTENTGALGWNVKVQPGTAVIQVDVGGNIGKYLVRMNDEQVLPIPTPAASARTHLVVLRVRDNQLDASGFSDAILDVVQGGSTSNPGLPDNAIPLATVAVAASGQSSVQNANIIGVRWFTGPSHPSFMNRSSVATVMTASSTWYPVVFNSSYSYSAEGVTHATNSAQFKVERSGWYQCTGQFALETNFSGNLDGDLSGYGATTYPNNPKTKFPLGHFHGGNDRTDTNKTYTFFAGIGAVQSFGIWAVNGTRQAIETSVSWYAEKAYVTIPLLTYQVYLKSGSTIEYQCYTSEVAGISTNTSNAALQPWVSATWLSGGPPPGGGY